MVVAKNTWWIICDGGCKGIHGGSYVMVVAKNTWWIICDGGCKEYMVNHM